MFKHWKSAALLIGCVGSSALSFAFSQSANNEMSLEQLTKNADEVVLGKVEGKSAGFVAGHIETTYDVSVGEQLKGKTYRSGTKMQLTVMGGDLTTPPLSQYVQGQPLMYKGEDVALFVKTSAPKLSAAQQRAVSSLSTKTNSKLFSTPRVVGMQQGKFTVFTGKDGRKMLTHINLEDRAMVPQAGLLDKTVQAIANGQVKTTAGPVVPVTKSAAANADPLEQKPVDPSKLKRVTDEKQAITELHSGDPFPVQDLEEFKSQVKQFSQE
jgi:hypothetical protein